MPLIHVVGTEHNSYVSVPHMRNFIMLCFAGITAAASLSSVYLTDSYFRECARTLQIVLTQIDGCVDIHCATETLKSAGLPVSNDSQDSLCGRLEVNYYLTHRGPEHLIIRFVIL